MNFFDDDFGLGDSPTHKGYSAKPPMPKKPSTTKSIKAGDDLDDLMDELLVKEAKRNEKKKGIQNTSHAQTEKHGSPSKVNLMQTQRWEPFESMGSKNNFPDLGKTYEPQAPIRNRPSTRSIYDGSEDNKSVMSGRSGVPVQQNFSPFFDGLNTVKPLESNLEIPSRNNMMKPPLRKRESRQPSIAGGSTNKLPDNSLTSFQDLESVKLIPPSADFTKPSQHIKPPATPGLELSESMPREKEKIVYVKEDNSKLKEEHDKQIKLISESHERQIQFLKEELEKETKAGKEMKLKLMKEFEEEKAKEKLLHEQLAKKDLEKTKEMYEWEIKKKVQSYELEIQKLKRLSDMAFSHHTKSESASLNFEMQREELKIKEKELEYKVKRCEDLQRHIRQKQKSLENQEFDFDNYRRREEEKLQNERKSLYNLEADLQKKKSEIRKHCEGEKLNLVNDLAKQELEISRQRERVKLDRQQLDMERQLFEKQKIDYEDFNGNIIKDYKIKLRELEISKQEYQEKEMELYKKIHTVQLMANAKGIKMADPASKPKERTSPKTKKHNENDANADNQRRRGESEPHREDVQEHHNIASQPQESYLDDHVRKSSYSYMAESNTNLKSYLLKMNKDNKRMRPSFV